MTDDLDISEFIPSYIFDIVENDWKTPFERECEAKIINA